MARWQVTISGKNIRKAGIEKLAEKLKEQYGEEVHINVQDASPPESRSDRFQDALSKISDAKSEMESLKDELQDWFDNLPEQFQSGDKGSQLEEAIGELETIIGDLENQEGASVNFPSMMG